MEDPSGIMLMLRVREGDEAAFEALHARYQHRVVGFFWGLTRDALAANELAQETFLRVWNRVHGFDQDRGALGPWVLTVARNRAIDYLRSVHGRDVESPLEAERMENPSLFLSLESDILNIDRMRRLKTAFEKLTPNQRTVIELAYYEGLSQTEMSEHLKQPLGTVKTWVRTALKSLREELDPRQVVA